MNIISSSRLVSWGTQDNFSEELFQSFKYFNEKSVEPGKIIIT